MANARRKILIVLVVLLFAANGILWVTTREKQTKLKRAQLLITYDSVLEEHIASGSRMITVSLKEMSRYEPKGASAISASIDLMKKINELSAIAKATSTTDPEYFFSERMTIDKSLRDSLFSTFQRFDAEARAWYSDTVSAFFYPVLKRARQNYRRMIETLNAAPENATKNFVWNIELEDTVIEYNVKAVKRDNLVSWDEIGAQVPRHIRNLDYFAFKHPLDVYEHLAKLKKALGAQGKVTMDERTYDLGDISPAQLEVVAKHLQILQMDVSESLLFRLNLYRDGE